MFKFSLRKMKTSTFIRQWQVFNDHTSLCIKRSFTCNSFDNSLASSSSQLSLVEEQALLRYLDLRKSSPHFTKRLVEDLYVEGKKPSGTIILKALGIATRWRLYQDAYFYYELSRGLGLRPASAFYSNLITLCGCRKDWNSAFRFYQEVIHEGVPADHLLYRALLFCCAVLGDSDRIKYVIALMQKEGLSLDETCHAILMECCRIRKDYEQGLAIFENMPFNRTHRTFQVLFGICRDMNDYSKAMYYYQQFCTEQMTFSEISISLLLDTVIKHQQWDQVFELFHKSIQQDIYPLSFIYFQYALGLLRNKQMDHSQVLNVLHHKPSNVFIPNSQYKALIAEAKSRGDSSLVTDLTMLSNKDRLMELKVESYAHELQTMGCLLPFGELKRLAVYRYKSAKGNAPPPPLWSLGCLDSFGIIQKL
ncbi:hypothetical protein GpartN1_g6444.t1 [Galdieria partita]|uniref:PROP1-like PPR domain-containing protein n=1 Tax=Galdieria partita TaxID=83374 RepID=A0A9C7Q1B6_9RHOD|nr:hypothetical protein GpartN1_g6444.t1 [Galdieria partita]